MKDGCEETVSRHSSPSKSSGMSRRVSLCSWGRMELQLVTWTGGCHHVPTSEQSGASSALGRCHEVDEASLSLGFRGAQYQHQRCPDTLR